MSEGLVTTVRDLVRRTRADAVDERARTLLDTALERLDGPLRLAVAGRVKAGKSTLLNAMVGEELAPTDAGECTKVVTWYVGSDRPLALVHLRDGTTSARPYRRSAGPIEVDLGAPVEAVDHVEIRWPTSRLRDVTLIDTPGIASVSAEVSARTSALLTAHDEVPSPADAVLYLLRHAHASDVRFLEAFHDDEVGRGSPVNAVGVLSRADEIGSARLDALQVAARIADRYTTDPRMRRLCPLVVPVAGLLAQAGATLREDEYRALARVAALPPEQTDELLLTASRLVVDDPAVAVTAVEREHLLARLGLFGVRLAVGLIRSGEVTSATGLARRLAADGGLDRLRTVLLHQFLQRSRLLQARSALTAVRAVARRGGLRDAVGAEVAVEEVEASAHELVEVRLLDDLRSGAVEVPDVVAADLDRVLGGSGHGPAERLGLSPDAPPETLRAAALDALARWQQTAESPVAPRATRVAARAAARTCEGIVAALAG